MTLSEIDRFGDFPARQADFRGKPLILKGYQLGKAMPSLILCQKV
jgi:hypothetical protein